MRRQGGAGGKEIRVKGSQLHPSERKKKKNSAKVTAHPSSNIIHHRRLLASAEQRHQQPLRSRDGNMGTQTDMFTASVVEELLWLKIPSTSKSFDVLPVQLNPQYFAFSRVQCKRTKFSLSDLVFILK